MARLAVRFAAVGVAILGWASAAEAQNEPSRWGVAGAIVPVWSVPSGSSPLGRLAETVFESGDLGIDIDGADFRIGIVRGRMPAGEWGVSYVRRTIDDGSTQGAFLEDCQDTSPFGQPQIVCFVGGEKFTYRDTRLNGLEVNKFIPVVTIRRRLQVGVDVAGGFGAISGTAEQQQPRNDLQPVFNAQGQFVGQMHSVIIDTATVDAKDLMVFDPTLLGRVEFAVAGIVTTRLKVRFSAGMNFPGSHVASVSASYFFGRN
jgi:hypothetical protein